MDDLSGDEAREFALELVEMMLLEPLDAGEEASVVEDEEYGQSSRPRIEDETGLEHPDSYEVVEYPSGQQLIFDSLSGSLEQHMPEEVEETEDEDFNLSDVRDALEGFSTKLGGLMEQDSEGTYRIIYVPENIQRASENQSMNAEQLERGVKIEEGLHATQKHNHPGIFERKEELSSQLQGPEKKDEFLALMSAIEGHALFYTSQIAPGYTDLDREVDLEDNPGMELLDIEDITTQYESGVEFISELYERGGRKYANLPLQKHPNDMDEINNPEQYLQRVE